MNDFYLKRKIDDWLFEWKGKKNKNPALICGPHQCGKTESVHHFAKAFYKNLIEINFWTHPEFREDFNGSLDVNTLIANLALRFPNSSIDPKHTLLFFDEIQECPRARLSFKSFALDGRFDVIGSGSFLGINGYVTGDATPIPIGYEDSYQMNTMDFEEFMWANQITDKELERIEQCFKTRKPVPDNLHQYFKVLFQKYMCIGGFPKPVSIYVKEHQMMDAIREMQKLIFDMKTDFGRRQDRKGNPLFKPSEVARIQYAFDLIPTFLAKENSRFITSKIASGSSSEKVDAIEYLRQSHIVEKVHNLENISLPLEGNKIISQFKLFPTDIGLVTSMYGQDTLIALHKGTLGQAKGALFEAAVFDSLYKSDIHPYYFAKETGLEVDFVICYDGYTYLVEAKSKNGNTKSSKTIMNNPDHYGTCRLLKVGDYNVGEQNDIWTIPHYMVYMLGKFKPSNPFTSFL